MPTVKFYTLGCKVNQYDTQIIREQFLNSGFREVNSSLRADIYLVNTCTVTQKADAESLNFIRRAKRENPKAKIIVTGCLAELDAQRIKEIGKAIKVVKNKDKKSILSGAGEISQKGLSGFGKHTRAFLKIQDGCDNFCAYCKVPLVRGRSKSRNLNEIVLEARRLVAHGFKEIVLCGICLGAFGKDLKNKVCLEDVISALEKIVGLFRIRLSSIEAGDVSSSLIKTMAGSTKLCPHLHIPMQSGDDQILRQMNRKYTQKKYLNLICKIKKEIPEIGITTDIMVGFPGESEENFQNTVKLVKEIVPLGVHIFPFSARKSTPAYEFEKKINPLVIKQRINYLNHVSQQISFVYKKKFLGRRMPVLFEQRLKENHQYWQGYTRNYLRVLLKSQTDLKNHLVAVKLQKITPDYILATK